jgi:hypothetical protein
VLVAAKDLPKGTVVRQEVLSQRRIPQGFVANDAIAAADYEKYLGRVLEADVGAGKPLLTSYLDNRFPVDFSDIVPGWPPRHDHPGRRPELDRGLPAARQSHRPVRQHPVGAVGFLGRLHLRQHDRLDPGGTAQRHSAGLAGRARGADTSDATVKDLLANALPKELILPVLQDVRVLATGRDPYREELDQLAYPQPRAQRTFNTVTLDLSPARSGAGDRRHQEGRHAGGTAQSQ